MPSPLTILPFCEVLTGGGGEMVAGGGGAIGLAGLPKGGEPGMSDDAGALAPFAKPGGTPVPAPVPDLGGP